MAALEVIADTDNLRGWLSGVGRFYLRDYLRNLIDMVDWGRCVLRVLHCVDDILWHL